jgi:hypothetical protein
MIERPQSETQEGVFVETLVAKSALEALDECILNRLAGLNAGHSTRSAAQDSYSG